MTDVLSTVDLTRSFPGIVANDRVDFDLRAGEIHCLFGENGAGKSTLCACLSGALNPDSGRILVQGRPVRFRSPADAIAAGIGMVHQHFVLVGDFTVLENIVVGTHRRGWRLGLEAARAKLAAICTGYGIVIDPDARVADLAVGQQQWVEILKALYLDARILILDEPTAVLTPDESARLFRILGQMRAQGLSILLISHKMSEVLQADRVTVLRKGRVVATVRPAEVSARELSRMMVGRDVALRVTGGHRARPADPRPVLEVDRVSWTDPAGRRRLRDVSLTIGRGEILGLAGVSGNGQKELFEVLSGILVPDSGRVTLAGERIEGQPARHYMDRGVGLVPDDRYREGLVGGFGIAENVILGWQRDPAYARGPFLDRRRIAERAARAIADFRIAAPSPEVPVRKLSGGNAQKVILAREFAHSDKLLLANQPTRGLDLGVIEYVYTQILARRDEGFAVLLASEELEDLLNLSDRIAVISGGRITGIVEAARTGIAEIAHLMAAGAAQGAAA